MQRLLFFSVLLFSVLVQAADDKPPETTSPCESSVTSHAVEAHAKGRAKFEVIPSDRVPGDVGKYQTYVQELTEPGGVLDKLGIKMTGQIVEFLQGRDLNALTSGTSGGYPVSFYLDGAQVIKALQPRGSFALEVVYPGPQFQHGFYRDDNPENQQKSIIDHVVGHNNFAYTSVFPHYRAAQGLLSSRRMDDVLKDMYSAYNKDEVQRYYLWSMTLAQLVDWYGPHYQSSKEFEPKLDVTNWDPLGRVKPKIQRHPKAPTENLLAAFAGNIAPHQPPWKREILDLFSDAGAFRPALVHTQIMNEGWASIMQEIIPMHTKHNHEFNYWIGASRVMQTESSPNLQDPYSLGVFAWRRLRFKFEQRAEIRVLKTQLEKDRAFIQYADDEIIARMDDAQFLRLALDQPFIDKHKLAIIRKAKDDEQDPNLPPPAQQPEEPIAQWIVVTRSAEKVVQNIIDAVLKPKYNFHPRAKLVDFTRPGSGEIELVIDDEVGRGLAIDKLTVGPSLFAISNIIDKAVSLDCYVMGAGQTIVPQPQFPRPWWWPPEPPPQAPMLQRVRIVVSPAGEVRVYKVTGESTPTQDEDSRPVTYEQPDPLLTKEIGDPFREYIADLYLEDDHELAKLVASSQTLRGVTPSVTSMVENTPYDSLVLHSPNAAGAIMEYQNMLDRRLLKAMERASRTSRGIQSFGDGMRVKALPSAMYLQFDRKYMQAVLDSTPGGNVDAHKTFARHNVDLPDVPSGVFGDHQGDHGQTRPINGNPGDHFWGPDNPNGGGKRGPQPSEDENDPSWVDIPKDLYSKFLGERVRLPILNPKPGQSRTNKFKPGRRLRRMWGQMLPNEIAENAFRRGVGKAQTEGRDPLEDVQMTFDEGFENLQPRDWVVKNKVIAKKPDTKAVVTFVLDASGSTAHYLESFKRFVNDVEALVASNYKGFAFRYVVFDHQAHVMKSKADFFKFELGGGTDYDSGIKAAHKMMEEEYPRNVWDRYTFIMGDMQDGRPDQAYESVMKLLDDSEFLGMVAGLHAGENDPWIKLFTRLKQQIPGNPQIGTTILDTDGGYRIDHIREVLRNNDEPEK